MHYLIVKFILKFNIYPQYDYHWCMTVGWISSDQNSLFDCQIQYLSSMWLSSLYDCWMNIQEIAISSDTGALDQLCSLTVIGRVYDPDNHSQMMMTIVNAYNFTHFLQMRIWTRLCGKSYQHGYYPIILTLCRIYCYTAVCLVKSVKWIDWKIVSTDTDGEKF